MARQVLPIVGAAVGAYFGGPAGAQAGYAIGSLIGNAVDPVEIKGPKIGDNGVQTSQEGAIRPVVYGTGPVVGNVITRGNRVIRKKKEKQGKGGPVTITEHVYWTFAIRICEGPIAAITRIWEDEKLVYDVRPGSPIAAESAKYAGMFRLYLGDETQEPDPDLEVYTGMGNVPAYRGTAYIVFPNYDLTDRRESIPNYRFEVATDVNSVAGTTGWNPAETVAGAIFTDGNRTATIPTGARRGAQVDSFRGPDGAWYGEFVVANAVPGGGSDIGLASVAWDGLIEVGGAPVNGGGVSVLFDGRKYTNGSGADYFDSAIDSGDVVGVAYKDGSVWFSLNGVWGEAGDPVAGIGAAFTGLSQSFGLAFSSGTTGDPSVTVRTKQDEFSNPVPDGFLEWFDNGSVIGGPVSLGPIVSAIHGRARQPSSKYSVTELTDMVDGVVLQADFTCADAIRSLMAPYFFDADEHDGRIYYPKRGKPVVKTLTIDDLVDEPEGSTRESAIEYPRKLHMFFMNPLIGYAPAKATASRSSPDVRVVGEATVQIPVVVDDVDEAAQIADKLMKIAWAEAEGETVLTVTDRHLDLTNTDNVGVFLRGQVSRRRIVHIEDNPGTRKLTLRNDRQSAYTSNVTGIPLPAPTPPRPSIAGATISEFLDLPALTDQDDDLHYLLAATGASEAWSGALVERSLDGGANYVDAASFNGNTAMGVLLDPVTDASPHYTDTTNVVRVQLYVPDEIDNLTTAQFLSRGGAFALENADGSWEVMQYRDADDEGDNVVALSHLLRGRLDTEPNAHLAGRRFVLFDLLRKVPAVSAWIDEDLTHRATSYNTSPESAIPYTDTYTAQSQTEWPISSVDAERTGDTLTGTIVPRHRFGTDDNPVRSINWDGYQITVTDGSLTQTVTSLADSFSIDLTGYASPVDLTIAQLNRWTGAGPSVTQEIA